MKSVLAGFCAIAAAAVLNACVAVTSAADRQVPMPSTPGRTVHDTMRRAISLLEMHRCDIFAVEFLSPIKRAQIEDLERYRQERSCAPDDRGNIDDVLLALKLALNAEPVVSGVKATIDLSGIATRVTRLEFVKYIDGLWYFNEL